MTIDKVYGGDPSQKLLDIVNDTSGRLYLGDVGDKLLRSTNGDTINYVVSGDSTRSNTYNKMEEYYGQVLGKVLVTLDYNAESGQSGYNWLNDIGSATITGALSSIPNDGEDTILEYSFGINDFKSTPNFPDFDPNEPEDIAVIQSYFQDGIDALLAAKPLLTILLVTPVFTSNAARNTGLRDIYIDLAQSNDLELVDIVSMMGDVHDDSAYYEDTTHPSEIGSRRIVNFIANKIIPNEIIHRLEIDEMIIVTSNLVGNPNIESGYYATTSGVPIENSSWRRVPNRMYATENTDIIVKHQGNRARILCIGADDVFIESTTLVPTGTANEYSATTATGTSYLLLNLTSDGAAYDLLDDQPSVEYVEPLNYMSADDINKGNDIVIHTDYKSTIDYLLMKVQELNDLHL